MSLTQNYVSNVESSNVSNVQLFSRPAGLPQAGSGPPVLCCVQELRSFHESLVSRLQTELRSRAVNQLLELRSSHVAHPPDVVSYGERRLEHRSSVVSPVLSEVVRGPADTGDHSADILQLLIANVEGCLLYTSPSPRDATLSRMPSSA